MTIGVALPQMATGLDRDRLVAWCRGIDQGPFSSVSAGERITFHNLDGFTLCTAAAALTERVRVLVNVAVLPWHAPALVAKELASMDVVSGGRVELAVGVGGRHQDYDALGSPFRSRWPAPPSGPWGSVGSHCWAMPPRLRGSSVPPRTHGRLRVAPIGRVW